MKNNRTLRMVVVFLVLALVAALGAWIGMKLSGDPTTSEYSVVSMTNGDIYFGKLSWFPKLHLTNAWTIQRTPRADGGTDVSIVPLTRALWQPSDMLYLNKKNMISWAHLSAESQLAKALANPSTDSSLPAEDLPATISPGSSTTTP